MTRWTSLIGVALIFGGAATASAGQRTAQRRTVQPPAIVAPAPPPPASGTKSVSRMTFTGGKSEAEAPPGPARTSRPGVHPGFPLLWWGWAAPYSYAPLPAGAPLAVPPQDAPKGGLQLDVLPRRAQVYVDGVHVGVVDEFKGYYHHLELPAGLHSIVIVERGYQPLELELVVPPGRTTTYRGTLNEAPSR